MLPGSRCARAGGGVLGDPGEQPEVQAVLLRLEDRFEAGEGPIQTLPYRAEYAASLSWLKRRLRGYAPEGLADTVDSCRSWRKPQNLLFRPRRVIRRCLVSTNRARTRSRRRARPTIPVGERVCPGRKVRALMRRPVRFTPHAQARREPVPARPLGTTARPEKLAPRLRGFRTTRRRARACRGTPRLLRLVLGHVQQRVK